jgi:alkanesulfonate monooxygenase SsuD/methylene tetrahydromethanopterin reductase-like flavin-dependent oxidoreductase (luciferase family)
VKLGIGLPNTMGFEVNRQLMLDWARLADAAGFDSLGTIDKPNYDARDPLLGLGDISDET